MHEKIYIFLNWPITSQLEKLLFCQNLYRPFLEILEKTVEIHKMENFDFQYEQI